MKIAKGKQPQERVEYQRLGVCSKKSVQQGRSLFGARSVLSVREHGKKATCLGEAASAGMEPLACQPELWRRLAAFFNRPTFHLQCGIMTVLFRLSFQESHAHGSYQTHCP